jgi:hypothetical protein
MNRIVLPTTSINCTVGLAAILGLATGCNRTQPASLLNNPIASPAIAIGDATKRPKQFQALFVAGSAPNETVRKQMAALMFQVNRVHQTSDSEASLHILVDDVAGKRVGEVDWTVAKEHDQWKLKSTPLP